MTSPSWTLATAVWRQMMRSPDWICGYMESESTMNGTTRPRWGPRRGWLRPLVEQDAVDHQDGNEQHAQDDADCGGDLVGGGGGGSVVGCGGDRRGAVIGGLPPELVFFTSCSDICKSPNIVIENKRNRYGVPGVHFYATGCCCNASNYCLLRNKREVRYFSPQFSPPFACESGR